MKMSQMFTKTSKNNPADEVSKNAQLLIRAGFVHKEMAGVYDFLPLGKNVLDKIVQIIREEMNKIGGVEMSLTALQNPETWQATNRWDDEVMDVWFKTKLSNGREFGLAPTHEEPITKLMRNFISSYKDLPSYPYQFQTKFRAELRSKSGLMRGREFLMKDLYSFSKDKEQHDEFYEEISKAYLRIFDRLGLDEKVTYKKSKLEGMHPGRFAEVYLGEKRIGFIGEVHPQVADKLGLNTTYVFEINLDEVISESKVKPKYEEVTKYPEITRDIAMLVDVKDEYQNIYNVIESVNSKLITKVELFDLYAGAELLVGKKSLALTITYSDKQKTLTDEEVTAVHEKVLSALTEYGAIIR